MNKLCKSKIWVRWPQYFSQMIEEIEVMQQKLNERTDKLNAMKNRHNELTRTLDETETHLKQASNEKMDLMNGVFLVEKGRKLR